MNVPAAGSGSGIYLESLAGATLRDDVIRDNVGCFGVGVSALDVTIVVAHNSIRHNLQDSSCAQAEGGGIKVQSATAVIRDNDIRDNAASSGGGIAFDLSDGVISDNLLIRNSADVGGALRLASRRQSRGRVGQHAAGQSRDDGRDGRAPDPVPDDALRMSGNTINGDGAVELIRCETPFAVSRSNSLRNASVHRRRPVHIRPSVLSSGRHATRAEHMSQSDRADSISRRKVLSAAAVPLAAALAPSVLSAQPRKPPPGRFASGSSAQAAS